MPNLEDFLLPYIFMILFGLIVLNLVMNICLFSITRTENIKLLCWYWGSLLITYIFQGFFQNHQLSIVLSYGINVIPTLIMAMIVYNILDKELPIKFFFNVWMMALLITPLLHLGDFSFTIVAMPLSLAMGLLPLRTAYEIIKRNKNEVTPLLRFMAGLLLVTTIHFINFALFRMGKGNQLWGWSVSLALYQIFSVLMFALVLENQSRRENERLQDLVASRTQNLKESLKIKDTIFRMVLHDIATPIQGQLLLASKLQREFSEPHPILTKLTDMTNVVKRVIDKVRAVEAANNFGTQTGLSAVRLDLCLDDVKAIFENALSEKDLKLLISNELSEDTTFCADPTIFTYSVLGNLISNAIKFSLPGSTLELRSYEKSNKVIIEVVDHGIGMSEELAFNIFNPSLRKTTPGTRGEKGTGFGMSQVKTCIEQFGGEIELTSLAKDRYPHNHGTKVKLTMEKSLGHFQ
jgi:signal transduction histidine kinase